MSKWKPPTLADVNRLISRKELNAMMANFNRDDGGRSGSWNDLSDKMKLTLATEMFADRFPPPPTKSYLPTRRQLGDLARKLAVPVGAVLAYVLMTRTAAGRAYSQAAKNAAEPYLYGTKSIPNRVKAAITGAVDRHHNPEMHELADLMEQKWTVNEKRPGQQAGQGLGSKIRSKLPSRKWFAATAATLGTTAAAVAAVYFAKNKINPATLASTYTKTFMNQILRQKSKLPNDGGWRGKDNQPINVQFGEDDDDVWDDSAADFRGRGIRSFVW